MASAQHDESRDSVPQSPRVPVGCRIYAVGDIHGRADLLARLHREIDNHASDEPAVRRVVVYIGDYVDRGPTSSEVIEVLLNEPLAGFEAVHLKGNHEDLLLRYLAGHPQGEAWLFNGGVATLRSYGIEDLDMEFGGETTRRKFLAALPERHLAFFRGLKMFHEEGDYLFVHAGMRPGVPRNQQTEKDLLWIREAFLYSGFDFGKMVVHGHTAAPEPEMLGNRIGIDTGAYFSDRLTCLVLEGTNRCFLRT